MTTTAPRPLAPRWWRGVAGAAALVGLWAVLASTVFSAADGVPTPWAVLAQLGRDGWEFYRPHLRQTGGEALRGYLIGTGLALAAAAFAALVPPLERIVTQVAVASYCIPIVALGPILSVLLTGDAPMVAMAAIGVYFTTLVGALLGLRSADHAHLRLVRAYGGGRWQQLRRVRLVAAAPGTLAGLRTAAPTALLGAIVGEYLGRLDTGLGVAMTISQQQLQTARTWDIALVCGALAGTGYGLTALAGHLLLPWARAAVPDGPR